MMDGDRFAKAGVENRILPLLHCWPDDPDERSRYVKDLVDLGFGGVVTNVHFDGYVESEERWQQLLDGIEKARAASSCGSTTSRGIRPASPAG